MNLHKNHPIHELYSYTVYFSASDPALTVEVVKAQILDTKTKIVVASSEAAKTFLAANSELSEEDRVKHILVIDRDPWSQLPEGCSSFRTLYNDDGASCPKTLPGIYTVHIKILTKHIFKIMIPLKLQLYIGQVEPL